MALALSAIDLNNLESSRSPEKSSTTTVCASQIELYKDVKEYEPYSHRNVKHPTSYCETLVHLIKCSMGSGILAMPYAFANAGYLVGVVGTILIGVICIHAVHILIASEYELCKRYQKPSMTYPETLEAAISEGPGPTKKFAKYAPFICNLFLVLYEIGSCSVYVIFIATNIKDVVDAYQLPEDRLDIRLYCVFILPPFLLVNIIRNYKYLVPLSAFGTFVAGISYVIVLYYLFSEMPDISQRYAVAPIGKIPLFFSTVVFALEAICVIFPLENEMKNPKEFRGNFGVINGAMIPITIIFMGVGLFGFLRYGEHVKGTITLSLPTDQMLSQAVRILLSLAVFTSLALVLQTAIDVIWDDYLKQVISQRRTFWHYVLRLITVLVTFALAIAVPYLELFISLIGSFCMSMLCLMFPAIIQTCTLWNEYKGAKFALFIAKNSVVALIAGYGLSLGVETSIQGIIERFAEDYGT